MEPLSHTIRVTVRFMESDLLRMAWHGNYVRWLEDARQALGARIGLGYEDFMRERIACPIVDMHIAYKRPARYGDKLDVTAALHWTDVPKLVHHYQVRRAGDNELLTTAETVQVMLHPGGELALNFPAFLEDFRRRWQQGAIKPQDLPEPSPWA